MNLSLYLNVYNHITSHGDKHEDKFLLNELSAWHDFDGYTCYLGYKDLTMTLYFHSRFSFDYEDESTYKSFISLVDSMQAEL